MHYSEAGKQLIQCAKYWREKLKLYYDEWPIKTYRYGRYKILYDILNMEQKVEIGCLNSW